MRAEFPIVGGFGKYKVEKLNAERTINLYVVKDPTAKNPSFLAPFPGFDSPQEFTSGTNGCRASLVTYDILSKDYVVYVAVGDQIYLITQTLSPSAITSGSDILDTTSGYVSMASISNFNNNEILFCDGSVLLSYKPGDMTPIAKVTLPDSAVPQYVTAMDNYFIVSVKDTQRFFVSKLSDGRGDYSGRFVTASTIDGIIQAVMQLERRVFIFGDFGIESWFDAGASDFPFRRDNNVFIEHGLLAVGSLCEGAGRLFYLAQSRYGSPAIMMIEGNTPKQISDIDLDRQLEELINPEDAIGFVFRIEGHLFYQLNFTTDQRTFLYSLNSDEWTELEMAPATLHGTPTRHAAQCHFFYYGATGQFNTHYIGDYNNPTFYILSSDYYKNNGQPILKTRICHVFYSNVYNYRVIDRLLIDMLQGAIYQNPTGASLEFDDDDPKVNLSISRDGGNTYKFIGQAKIGKAGDQLFRTFWSKLGTYRSATVKIEVINTVPVYILGAAIDYEECAE
jgi:hypothetical protein